VDGTAVTAGDLILYRDGRVRYGYWTRGDANIVLTYIHGHETVPGDVKQAALLWTQNLLMSGPIDDRALTYSTDDASYTMAVPGMRGSLTGIPFVDAVIAARSLNVAVA
jgi:hypothetical protein